MLEDIADVAGVEVGSGGDDNVPREIALRNLPDLAGPYGQHLCHVAPCGLELPYAALGGRGFERLCFHLLLFQGERPRFFGRAGQAQFGIDLVVSDGRCTQVYQCKNKTTYTAADLRMDLGLFAQKWLREQPDLPRPNRFVICCSARIDLRGEWEKEKNRFLLEHGVTVEEWHRDTLDIWLRRQPDIVADLFGDDVAERFCECDGWNDGLFRPLLPGGGQRDIERFLELRAADRLVHEPTTVARFNEIVTGQRLVLLEGLSGNGKTMAALDLSASLDKGTWRVFFVSLLNGSDEQQLFQGIKARCVRPTLFILDDCHRDFATTERIVSRTRRALRGHPYGLVLTAQTASDDAESIRAEGIEFVEELREEQLAIRIAPTAEQYRGILARARPALAGLSHQSIQRLYSLTAHDLAVLDILLEAVEDRALSDSNLLADLFPGVLLRYFRHEKVHAANLKSLAAVAQYDIAVPVSMLPDPFEVARNRSAVERLTIRIGQPDKAQPTSLSFVHASAAELIFRALCWVDADQDWTAAAAREIVSYLNLLLSPVEFLRTFDFLLNSRLRLSDDSDLKRAVLVSTDVSRRLVDQSEAMPLRTLSLMTFLTRSVGVAVPYSELLAERIERIVINFSRADKRDLPLLGFSLRSLALADPKRHAAVEAHLGVASILRLIKVNGTILDLFRILEHSTSNFAARLIAELDSSAVSELIEKTIAEGRPVGTLNLALRELAERDMLDGGNQLDALEAHLGAASILRLIKVNGTILEMFRMLEHSTPNFAARLIAELDSSVVSELIEKTIDEGRSIGTLNFALRKLAKRNMPDGGNQLEALEANLSCALTLRLIRANGTVFELFGMLASSTASFAARLIAELDPSAVSELIEKTIGEGRSIGTLSLALRKLAEREMPDGGSQLAALEARLGGAPTLRLIRANGTIFELFMILKYSSLSFATGLIAALDSPTVTELIERTIAEGRSIGTLHTALRKMAERSMPDGSTQLVALEVRIGGASILRLIRANGTIFELFKILQYSTPTFAAGLIAALDSETVSELIEKTIVKGRSIGTLNFTLRELHRTNPHSLARLEHLIDVGGFWRLVLGAGDFNDLAYLLGDMTPVFHEQVFASDCAPSLADWLRLARRGGFYAITRFIRDSINGLPIEARERFATAVDEVLSEIVESSSWADLSAGLTIIDQLTQASWRTKFEAAAFARIDKQEIDGLSFDGFIEAANGLSCLWQRRDAFRPMLGRRFWTLLPPESSWPDDYSLFVGGWRLMQIGKSEHLPDLDAERLVDNFRVLACKAEVEKAQPRTLRLFVWALFDLWKARGRQFAQTYSELQSKEFWDRVEAVVMAQAEIARLNEEKLDVLALAGLLTLVLQGRTKRMAQQLRGKIKGMAWLIDEADELQFVPAVLAIRGLSLIDPYQARFSSDRRSRLLALAKTVPSEEAGPANEFLCSWLRRDDRFHQPVRY